MPRLFSSRMNVKDAVSELNRMTKEPSDAQLLLSAIIQGKAKWEFFHHSQDRGKVCVDGVHYGTKLDEHGCPLLYPLLHSALVEVMKD